VAAHASRAARAATRAQAAGRSKRSACMARGRASCNADVPTWHHRHNARNLRRAPPRRGVRVFRARRDAMDDTVSPPSAEQQQARFPAAFATASHAAAAAAAATHSLHAALRVSAASCRPARTHARAWSVDGVRCTLHARALVHSRQRVSPVPDARALRRQRLSKLPTSWTSCCTATWTPPPRRVPLCWPPK
jgi:hypothetical protein